MASRKPKNLPPQILFWWLFNAFASINISIQFWDSFSDSIAISNNTIIHALYNITSIFAIIPFNLAYIVSSFFFGLQQASAEFRISYLTPRILIITFLLSLVTNYILSKLLFSSFAQSIYSRYIKFHKTWAIAALVLILIIMATNGQPS